MAEPALNAGRHSAPLFLHKGGNTSAALWPGAEQTLLGLIHRPREPLFRVTNLLALQAKLLRAFLLLSLPPARHTAFSSIAVGTRMVKDPDLLFERHKKRVVS